MTIASVAIVVGGALGCYFAAPVDRVRLCFLRVPKLTAPGVELGGLDTAVTK